MSVSLRNLGPNCHVVKVGDVLLGFSYETCVGFAVRYEWVMSENVWSRTTGKHINMIGGTTAKRVPYEEFQHVMGEALADAGVGA